MTNLVLEAGHEVAFQSDSQVYTFVPETIGGYIKQQVRWNKSFYREMLWTIKFAHKHPAYMMYDLVMQFIFTVYVGCVFNRYGCPNNFVSEFRTFISVFDYFDSDLLFSVHCMVFIELKMLDFYSLLSMALCTY